MHCPLGKPEYGILLDILEAQCAKVELADSNFSRNVVWILNKFSKQIMAAVTSISAKKEDIDDDQQSGSIKLPSTAAYSEVGREFIEKANECYGQKQYQDAVRYYQEALEGGGSLSGDDYGQMGLCFAKEN